jgi:glycosyltransferase involved in cell wall biosynthesis
MRIAIVSPLELRVPPSRYGGIELVVSLLTEELVRRGHKVTLFASGDSITSAMLDSVAPKFLRGSGRDGSILTMLNVVSCLERANDFDLVHNHTRFEGLATAGLIRTPMLTTLHGGLSGDWLLLFQHYKGWYNTISHSAKSLLPPKEERFVGVIHNGIDVASYPFRSAKDDYLLFLSRMSPEKGPHLAIEVAQRMGKRLRMAGSVHPVDRGYFETAVLPHVDGKTVEYLGEVDHRTKVELLSRAHCLLAPITWPEPFGLFMVESMACGTPVVALNKGAAPEVVVHNVTGYVVNTVEEMIEAVRRVERIEPRKCREHAEKSFAVECMVDGYISAYQRILETDQRSSHGGKQAVAPSIPQSSPNHS